MLPVGADALLLLLLLVARMPWLAESLGWWVAPALAVVGMSYLAADLFARRCKPLLLLLAIALYVVVPTARLIVKRHQAQPFTYVHDNVIQTEEAVKMVLHGVNPYSADYLNTPLYQWDPQNPALYHYINLPLQIVVALPTLGRIDLRIVYTALFAITLFFCWRLGRDRESSLALMMVFALNPLFTRGQVEGRNDVLVTAALAGALSLMRERPRAAAVLVGLACAAKPTAWVLIPFYLLSTGLPLKEAIRKTWPAWATAAALMLPFIVWNPIAFYQSVWGYPAGTVAHSYPIRGDGAYGFATWVLNWHWVPNDQAYFPFFWFQIAFAGPCLVLCLRWQRRQNDQRVMLLGYALTLFVFQFFTRYFNQNHFAFILFLIALGVLGRPLWETRAKMEPA